jgi:mono/diheme cytochrome c family protein
MKTIAALAAAALICIAGCSGESGQAPVPSLAIPQPSPAPVGDPVEGLRVATRVGCNDCHRKDGRGGIFQENAKDGRIVAPNLTQRRELYDDAALEALLRRGKTHDGHVPINMPVKMFQHLSDQEIRDITAWLRSIPAVANPDLPEGAWSETLKKQVREGTYPYLDDMQPDPGNQPPALPPVEPLALGKHLAMTSCGECHAWDLNGWPGDSAPSLIVAKAYTAEKFSRLMKTGITATGKESTTGLMTQMGRERFRVLTDTEIAALKLYLDSR